MSSTPRFLGLSVTQLVASALAAITATVAASSLGVTGTVIGAALASLCTGIGTAVYSNSLQRTGVRIRAVTGTGRVVALDVPPGTASAASTGTLLLDEDDRPPVLPDQGSEGSQGLPRATVWRRVAFGTLAVFVALLVAITGVELVAGRPISDLLRGDRASGTSLFGRDAANTQPAQPATPVRTPTVVVTVTPQVVVTTPTVTQTAPPVTATVTPTVAPTTPTPSPTPSDTASPTQTGSSTAAG